MQFVERYGPWAFVAGASMGLGLAMSNEIASRGLNVVMLARSEARLKDAAAQVEQRHGVQTRAVAADLADPDIGRVVGDAVEGLDLGLFVYNAAVSPHGPFLEVPLAEHQHGIAVNCITPTTLCHLLGPGLVSRGRGGMVLVTSMGGFQGAIQFSSYFAGKAYEWILAESLWAELREHGVDVISYPVGATDGANYGGFKAALDPELCGKGDTDNPLERARHRLLHPSDPAEVATRMLDQLGDGPTCYSHPDDAWVADTTFRLSRREAVELWKGVQETALAKE